MKNDDMVRVVAHEILHFLWFQKWLELYPETKREELDSPYPVWEYSEMITDSILNSSILSKVHNFNEKSYNYFYNIKDGDNLVMDNLRKIYEGNDTIENKIIKGYNYVLPFIEKKNIIVK